MKCKGGSQLCYLGLSGNRVGSDGIVALAKALGVCPNLQSVDLSWNDISSNQAQDATAKLAEALQSPECMVTHLDLSHNFIADEGAKKLALALLQRGPQRPLKEPNLEANHRMGVGVLDKVKAALAEPDTDTAKRTLVGIGGNSSSSRSGTGPMNLLSQFSSFFQHDA